MKYIFLITSLLILLLSGCVNSTVSEKNNTSKSQVVATANLAATELPMAMESLDELPVQLTGTIVDVCQTSGCWMDLDMGDGQLVLVTFPEEVFVTPKEAVGKQATVEGLATKVIISVKRLQLQAADEGATDEEIEDITEPATEYSIAATKVEVR